MQKKIYSYTLLTGFIFGLLPFSVLAEENSYFVVTAYYSPLPDQTNYLKGNYEDEVILNGKGIAGASGKKVFSGMLAAPGKYNFGTKIYLEGLGVGAVEDRGGAIVEAGKRGYEHDRIDVWMGYGDEGLKRALYWGKRKVKGSVIDSGSTITLSNTSIAAPEWVTRNFTSATTKEIVQHQKTKEEILAAKLNIFDTPISDITSIKLLQTILTELEMYTGEIDGLYDSMKQDILQYQIEQGIILTKFDTGAGFFGPKTRNDLKKNYSNHIKDLQKKKDLEVAFEKWSRESEKEAKGELILIGNPIYGDISSGVRSLQISLKKIGYADYTDTAMFGIKTQNSILDFQKDVGLIENGDDLGAGKFGPKTQEAFVKKLSDLILIEKLKQEGIYEDIKVVTDLLKDKTELISTEKQEANIFKA